jgi:hypothetical protein
VTLRRFKLTVLSLMVALLATSALSFAQGLTQACVPQQHQCAAVPTISDCCCESSSGQPSTPAEQRVEVANTFAQSTPPALLSTVWFTDRGQRLHVSLVSPRVSLLDLPTLFSTLLI